MRSLPLIVLLASGCPGDEGGTPGSVPPWEAAVPPRADAGPPRDPSRTQPPQPRADSPEPRAHPSTTDPPSPPVKAERLELTFVGDIIFGRYRGDTFDPIIEDPSFDPFAEIRPALASDVVVGNLETPVVEQLPATSPLATPYRFGGTRSMVRDHLGDFTILSLANNHACDLGPDGQRQSPIILAEEGIVPIGAARADPPLHRVETHTTKGWTIGLVAVTTLLNVEVPVDGPLLPYLALADMPGTLLPLVERARADHDLVIVVVHWGSEYFEAPSGQQQRVARRLIDGGVDMVIGHHPHVLQAIERHGTGLIAYSLGNFLFEHTRSSPRLTGVLRTTWHAAPAGGLPRDACLGGAVFHPAVNQRSPHPHPVPATGRLAAQVRERIVPLAGAQGTRWVRVPGREDLRLAPAGRRRSRATPAGASLPPASPCDP